MNNRTVFIKMNSPKAAYWLLAFFFITIQSYGQKYDTIRYAREHYSKRVETFQQEPVTQGRIIFLGNSITEFGDWRKLLNDSTVVNRGVAGDNTFGVLDRLDDVISRQPRKVFIEVGINDLSQNIPIDVIVSNLSSIVTRLKNGSHQTQVYVHGIFPTNQNVKNEYPDAYNKNALAESVNKRLKKLADTGAFIYVDFATSLKGPKGELDIKYAELDGLHLNEVGYGLWVKFLKRMGCL